MKHSHGCLIFVACRCFKCPACDPGGLGRLCDEHLSEANNFGVKDNAVTQHEAKPEVEVSA